MASNRAEQPEHIETLVRAIMHAFPEDAERPARDALVTCGCEECAEIAAYFGSAGRYGNSVETLRYHSAAISLLNLDAFTYWLPAFMIAELKDQETADVIAPSLRGSLSSQDWLSHGAFTSRQRDAIVQFLLECSRRYDDDPIDDDDESTFRAVAAVVRRWNVVLFEVPETA